jgi:hypothetical protein
MFWDNTIRVRDILADPVLSKTYLGLERAHFIPVDFECNGCTCVADKLPWTPDMALACVVHDYDFHVGGGVAEWRAANRRFYRNLRHLGVSRFDAVRRYVGVTVFSAPFFNWTSERPEKKIEAHMRAVVAVPSAAVNFCGVSWLSIARGLWAIPAVKASVLSLVASAAAAVGVTLP